MLKTFILSPPSIFHQTCTSDCHVVGIFSLNCTFVSGFSIIMVVRHNFTISLRIRHVASPDRAYCMTGYGISTPDTTLHHQLRLSISAYGVLHLRKHYISAHDILYDRIRHVSSLDTANCTTGYGIASLHTAYCMTGYGLLYLCIRHIALPYTACCISRTAYCIFGGNITAC